MLKCSGPGAGGYYAVERTLEFPKTTLDLGAIVEIPIWSLLLKGGPVLVALIPVAGFASVDSPEQPIGCDGQAGPLALTKEGVDTLEFGAGQAVFEGEDREAGSFADFSERAEVCEEVVLEVLQWGDIAVHRVRLPGCDSITGTQRAGTG